VTTPLRLILFVFLKTNELGLLSVCEWSYGLALKIDMSFVVEQAENYVRVRLSGRLDEARAPAFQEKIDLVLKEQPNHLVIDTDEIDYISAAGLEVILETGKMLQANGRLLTLVAAQPSIRQLFDDAGFHLIFNLVDRLEQP